jgi:hypothetical protein
LDAIILNVVPPVVTLVMFAVKRLAGLQWFANGAENHTFLRFALALFSLLGVISTSLLTNTPINPDSISMDVLILLQTGISALGSHWIYQAIRSLLGR